MTAQPTHHDPELPPHSPEAERGVIGCLLVEAERCAAERTPAGEVMEECVRYGVAPDWFYDLRHRELWSLARSLADAGKPFDLILVTAKLTASNQLEAIGGLSYLNDMAAAVPSAANLAHYLAELRDKHALRHVLKVCAETAIAARNLPQDVTAFVAGFEAQTLGLSERHVPTSYRPISEHVPEYIEHIEIASRGRQAITGIETPWWYLNNMTAGLQRHELVVIGARPSTGKTAMGLDILRHALSLGESCLFFSIEMHTESIINRMVAQIARIDSQKLRNGFIPDHKSEDVHKAVVALGGDIGTRLFIDSRSFVTGQDVWVAARRAYRQHKISVVMVDYLQLMRGTREYRNRNEEVGECSAWLKRVAKELPVVVIALAQLNRESEKEKSGRAPTMADLRESGNVEQDADLIGMLWRPRVDETDYSQMRWLEVHKPDDAKETSKWFAGETNIVHGPAGKNLEVNLGWRDEFGRINLSIEKNRNGPTGRCELLLQLRSTRFVDLYSPNRVKENQGELI